MFRLSLVAMLVGIVLGVVATSSASAATFKLDATECKGGKSIALCWDKGGTFDLLEGEQTLEVKKKTGSAALTISGELQGAFTLDCEGLVEEEFVPLWFQRTELETLEFEIHLQLLAEHCRLFSPATLAKKCKVPENIETTALVGKPVSVSELKFVPEAGETHPLLELKFENNGAEACPSAFKSSPHAITGFQGLTVLNPEKPETTKSARFVEKSGLKLAGAAASITGEVTMSFPKLEDEVILSATA